MRCVIRATQRPCLPIRPRYALPVRFEAGQTIAVRYWRLTMLREVRPVRVIEDGARGVLVWLPAGTKIKHRVTASGQRPRRLADQLAATWHTVDGEWRGSDVLQWFPLDGSGYSVWWFFRTGRFSGWYVNLEDPQVRWAGGVDTSDRALDIQVAPDRSWRLKDQDELAERIGHPWFWTEEEARGIMVQAGHAIGLIEAADFPFDGTWCDFLPGDGWPVPELPERWNRPRATS
jgi:Protein of unknown function (DUF402)